MQTQNSCVRTVCPPIGLVVDIAVDNRLAGFGSVDIDTGIAGTARCHAARTKCL